MAAESSEVLRGIVLRETETKEADKILTLLTAERGRLSVIARGVRRQTCRYAAAAQTLAWGEWTLYHRGGWCYARDAAALELFEGLRTDLEGLALGCYFAELTEAVTAEGEPAPELLRHLLNGLYALNTLKKSPALTKAAFEWKLLSLAGYEPLADRCCICGREDMDSARLDAVQGVLRCAGCGGDGGLPLSGGALSALRHILYGEPRRLYAFTLKDGALRELARAAEASVMVQLERNFRTLDYYKRLAAMEKPSN